MAEKTDAATTGPLLGGVPTVTAEDARKVDALAAKHALSLEGMMGRAAEVSADILLGGLLEKLARKPVAEAMVTVLAGTGHKGAVALALGARLAEAGAAVSVVLSRKTKEYEGLGRHHLGVLEKVAKKVYNGYNERAFDQADLIIDGLIGAGLGGPPKASISLLVKGANFSMKPVVALDLPTGVDASSGVQSPVAVKAAATFCIGLPKRGMVPASNRSLCGRVFLIDLGIPPKLWKEVAGLDVGDIFQGKAYIELTA